MIMMNVQLIVAILILENVKTIKKIVMIGMFVLMIVAISTAESVKTWKLTVMIILIVLMIVVMLILVASTPQMIIIVCQRIPVMRVSATPVPVADIPIFALLTTKEIFNLL